MNHYLKFRGTKRPDKDVQNGNIIPIFAYEPLLDRFVELELRVTEISRVPNATIINGKAQFDGAKHCVNIYISDRVPGEDSITIF